jgi:hypothetical protein
VTEILRSIWVLINPSSASFLLLFVYLVVLGIELRTSSLLLIQPRPDPAKLFFVCFFGGTGV